MTVKQKYERLIAELCKHPKTKLRIEKILSKDEEKEPQTLTNQSPPPKLLRT